MGQSSCSACCAKDRYVSRESELPVVPMPGNAADFAGLKSLEFLSPSTATSADATPRLVEGAFLPSNSPAVASSRGADDPQEAVREHTSWLVGCESGRHSCLSGAVGLSSLVVETGASQVAQSADAPEPELGDKEAEPLAQLEHALAEDMHRVRSALVPGESLHSFLMRFLRANHHKVKAAAAMVRAHVAWRDEHQPHLLADSPPGKVAGCAPELLEEYMPTWHQGYDKEGRPVIFSHYGKFRFRPIIDAGVTVEKILELHIRTSERTARLCGEQSRKHNREISRALIIMDTEGWDSGNLRQRAAFDWAAGIAKIDTEHYPERMWKLLILNAPSSVYYFFKMVSWFLPKKQSEAVKIYSGREQWVPELLALIDADQLPPEYGGSGPSLGAQLPVKQESEAVVKELSSANSRGGKAPAVSPKTSLTSLTGLFRTRSKERTPSKETNQAPLQAKVDSDESFEGKLYQPSY